MKTKIEVYYPETEARLFKVNNISAAWLVFLPAESQ